MFAWIKPHLTYANVMVTLLALGALTGGTAYAANTIFSDDIVDGQVKTADLAGGTVTVAKLADASVTGAKVKDATLSGPDVLDNSLKGADIDESTLSGVGGGGAPEAWHNVAAGSSSSNRCDDPSATAVFCTFIWADTFGEYYSPWHNYGGEFASAAFYKDPGGVVHLKGLVENPRPIHTASTVVAESPIFRLPTGYRPSTRRVFPTVGSVYESEVVQGRIDVQPNGLVTLIQVCEDDADGECSAYGGDITLDGITFRPNG